MLIETPFDKVDSHPAFKKVLEYLKRGRNGKKKIAGHTYLIPREEGIALHYWNTDIVMFRPWNFSIDLNGWNTTTTKLRVTGGIFRTTGLCVFMWTEAGKPVLSYPGGLTDERRYLYSDGITFDYDGKALNASPDDYDRWYRKRRRMSRAYHNNVVKSVMSVKEMEHELMAHVGCTLESQGWGEPPYRINREGPMPLIELPATINNLAVQKAVITQGFKVFKVVGLRDFSSDEPPHYTVVGVYLMGRDQTGQLWCHSLPPFGYALASIQACERWLLGMQPNDELVAEA